MAVISAIALLGPWAGRSTGPLVVVALATLLVLGGDVMFGSHLQISSLMGLQPVVGGRFYGMGNVTFALFATAALLLCIAVSSYFVTTRPAASWPPSPPWSSGWRPWSSTATPAGAPTAAARRRCCRAWPTSCSPSSASG